MSTTYRFADLVEQGHDEYSIRTQVRSGELSSVRHADMRWTSIRILPKLGTAH